MNTEQAVVLIKHLERQNNRTIPVELHVAQAYNLRPQEALQVEATMSGRSFIDSYVQVDRLEFINTLRKRHKLFRRGFNLASRRNDWQ